MTLITYSEALSRCLPGSSEFGWCIACHIHEPAVPLAGNDDVFCPACAHRLVPRFPELAKYVEAPDRTPDFDRFDDIPF